MTQQEIARRLNLDTSSVNKILNRRLGAVFSKKTIQQVFKTARELGFDFGRLKHPHRRRHERRPMNRPVEVSVYRGDGTLVEEGRAILKDLSVGGARLTELALPSGTLPLAPFEFALRWRHGAGEERARGRVVRLDHERRALGVEFLPSSAPRTVRAATAVAL